jgi:hypothetical protein
VKQARGRERLRITAGRFEPAIQNCLIQNEKARRVQTRHPGAFGNVEINTPVDINA